MESRWAELVEDRISDAGLSDVEGIHAWLRRHKDYFLAHQVWLAGSENKAIELLKQLMELYKGA